MKQKAIIKYVCFFLLPYILLVIYFNISKNYIYITRVKYAPTPIAKELLEISDKNCVKKKPNIHKEVFRTIKQINDKNINRFPKYHVKKDKQVFYIIPKKKYTSFKYNKYFRYFILSPNLGAEPAVEFKYNEKKM